MEIALRASIPTVPQNPHFSTSKWKRPKHLAIRCLGIESHEDINVPQSVESPSEKTQNDIWQLFTEAQRNILYLNKQRLMALEEIDELKREHRSLLTKIEELETKANAFKGTDLLATSSELLLRIDSMVLTGIIGTSEASDFRSLVMDSKISLVENFSDILQKSDREVLAAFRHFGGKRKMKGFHVIHICTEMAPAISVGSLASYVTGLCHALQRRGNLVEVILPKYASLNLDEVRGLREIEAEVYSYFNGQLHRNKIWTGVVHGIGVTFIQPVHYSSFFSMEGIYGYSNDFER